MNIWSSNSILLKYVENALHFRDFKFWRQILEIDPKKSQFSNDEHIMLKILQADCHFYLNDGLAASPLKELQELLKSQTVKESSCEKVKLYQQTYEKFLLEGNFKEAYTLFDQIVKEQSDIHALKRGQLIGFLLGQTNLQTDIAFNFDVNKCPFEGKYYYGMLSFAYGENLNYEKATESVQQGLSICEEDPWLHHAMMHNLYFTEKNVDVCLEKSLRFTKYWGELNAFLRSHNYWHLALFHVEKLEFTKAIQIFEEHLWNFSDQMYIENLINVSQLLWKLDMINEIHPVKEYTSKLWEKVYKELGAEQQGNLGYLMYNLLILKTLQQHNDKEAEEFLKKIKEFCTSTNKKCIPLIELLFENKYENWETLQSSFDNTVELLGSFEQLLVFQEASFIQLFRLQQYEDALRLATHLASVRPSPIYQNWLEKAQQQIKK